MMSSIGQNVKCLARLLLILIFLGESLGCAYSSAKLFQLFDRICITVYDIRENFSPKERADFAAAILPSLEASTKQVLPGKRVSSGVGCAKRGSAEFVRQMNVNLYVKRTHSILDGADLFVTTVGGGAPEVGAYLADYALLPVVLLSKNEPQDQEIRDALIKFYVSTFVAFMRIEEGK